MKLTFKVVYVIRWFFEHTVKQHEVFIPNVIDFSRQYDTRKEKKAAKKKKTTHKPMFVLVCGCNSI